MRIIAGALGGRQIKSIVGPPGYRPATGKVREAVFSMLESLGLHWPQMRVADIFAGSGSLGLEALSRGALSVDFLELNPKAVTIIRSNLKSLSLCATRWQVWRNDALSFLKTTPHGPWDLVFIDPPYGRDLLQPTLDLLLETQKLAPGGLVCAEVEAQLNFSTATFATLNLLRDRVYGQTRIYIWQKDKSV